MALDAMLAKKKNQRALLDALESELTANPVRFFKTVIMPLLPTKLRPFTRTATPVWASGQDYDRFGLTSVIYLSIMPP